MQNTQLFVLLILIHILVASGVSRAPNVVLIMLDDAGAEVFRAYGGEDYHTPNLDQLVAEGMRFDHAYSTPLCTPSRVMIMTGKHNFRNYTHFGRLNPAEHTIGHLMQEAGYRTAIAGKWQLNGLYDPELFTDNQDRSMPLKAGFHETCLWQVTKPKQIELGGGERFWSPPLEVNGELVSTEENSGLYGPDIMSGFLLDFMSRNSDKPFFVYYPSNLVHDPFVPTPDTIGDASRDQSANIQPADPVAVKANFGAMVEYLDKIIGRFVDQLEAIDQLENTLILFTADNGTDREITSRWQGRDIKGGKGGMTNTGTHVPFIAYWKGTIQPGSIVDDLVDFTDIYPTLADLAGHPVPSPQTIDGRSLLPIFLGEEPEPKEFLVSYYQPYWGRHQSGVFARNTDYKLYRDNRLYHVAEDYEETRHISGGLNAEERKLWAQLRAVLEQVPSVPSPDSGRPIYPYWAPLEIND